MPLKDPPGPFAGMLALEDSVITVPIFQVLERDLPDRVNLFDVVIEPNLDYPGGLEEARTRILKLVAETISAIEGNSSVKGVASQGIDYTKSQLNTQYLFARFGAAVMRARSKRSSSGESVATSYLSHMARFSGATALNLIGAHDRS